MRYRAGVAMGAFGVIVGVVACGESQANSAASPAADAAGVGGEPASVDSLAGNGGLGGEPSAPLPDQGGANSAGETGDGAGQEAGHAGQGGAAAAPEGGAAGYSTLAGSGGEGGQLSEVLSPLEVPGLAAWLSAPADSATTDELNQVSVWSDLSGNDNDAVAESDVARPTLLTSVLNGHAALRFDDEPSCLVVADSPSLRFGEGDFAYLMVARWRNDHLVAGSYGGAGALVAKVNAISPYVGVALFANFQSIYNAPSMRRLGWQLALGGPLALSYAEPLNDDQFRLLVARRVGEDMQIRINGEHDTRARIAGAVNVDAVGRPLTIGGWVGNQLRGDLAELVVIGGSTSDRDLQRLERGLMLKFGLSGG